MLLDNFPHKCTIQRLVRTRDDEDGLGGSEDVPTVEQTGVLCWEQQAGAREIADFAQRGQRVSRKVYFTSKPAVSTRHEIVITHRLADGEFEEVAEADQLVLTVMSLPLPDSSAGLGILYKVVCDEWTALR